MSRIEELKSLITKYDNAYRKNEPLVPDTIYDDLVDELVELIGEDDSFFSDSVKGEIDEDISSSRRAKCPITMASMTKVKTAEAIFKWAKNAKIPLTTMMILLPKYDGNSIAKEEETKKGYSKGRDTDSFLITDHLAYMNDISLDVPYTYGEVILSRDNAEKIKDNYNTDNPLGMLGMFRREEVSEDLKYADFIRYGVVGKDFATKKEMIDFLNSKQKVQVPYKLICLADITDEYLKNEVYPEFSSVYNIDGLIIEVDDRVLYDKLGRHKTSLNPNGARAYKGGFEETKETTILAIENSVSKHGVCYPTAIVSEVYLDGANVNRATLHNYSMLEFLGIGVGSTIILARMNQVIPGVVKVLTKKPFEYPDVECHWDENHTHLIVDNETDEMIIAKNLAFLKIIGVEYVSDKTVETLFNNGYKTIKDILFMKKDDFLLLDRFGESKAKKSFENIQTKLVDIPLSKLQHATSLFKSLGSRKLVLLEHFDTKPTKEEIMLIEGFSDILANNYLVSIDLFWEFIKDLPVSWVKTKKVEILENRLEGKVFVFSGYRDKGAENKIESLGGTIGSSVSKKTNYLVLKEKNSGNSKETKAIELGVQILDPTDLEKLIA